MAKPVYRVEIGFNFNAGHVEWIKKDFRTFFFRRRKALRYYLSAIKRAIKNNGSICAILYKNEQLIGRTEIDVRK